MKRIRRRRGDFIEKRKWKRERNRKRKREREREREREQQGKRKNLGNEDYKIDDGRECVLWEIRREKPKLRERVRGRKRELERAMRSTKENQRSVLLPSGGNRWLI